MSEKCKERGDYLNDIKMIYESLLTCLHHMRLLELSVCKKSSIIFMEALKSIMQGWLKNITLNNME